ncbi:hypothetical protein CR513_24335, partial [Mucuna pruriens]
MNRIEIHAILTTMMGRTKGDKSYEDLRGMQQFGTITTRATKKPEFLHVFANGVAIVLGMEWLR